MTTLRPSLPFSVLVAMLLTGCSDTREHFCTSNRFRTARGQTTLTKAEIEERFGRPQRVHVRENGEVWYYSEPTLGFGCNAGFRFEPNGVTFGFAVHEP